MTSQPASLPPIADDVVTCENLPLPVVYYPRRCGAFLAFAQDMKSTPVLCECARRPVQNLLRLRPALYLDGSDQSLARSYFPEIIAKRLASWSGSGRLPLIFVTGLCHRCNRVTPGLRYCDEAFADSFGQRFGWYVNQAYLRLWMLPQGRLSVSDDCPPDCRADLEAVHSVESAFQRECARLLEASYGADRSEVRGNGSARLPGSAGLEARRMVELRCQASQMRSNFKMKIQNMVRAEVGLYA